MQCARRSIRAPETRVQIVCLESCRFRFRGVWNQCLALYCLKMSITSNASSTLRSLPRQWHSEPKESRTVEGCRAVLSIRRDSLKCSLCSSYSRLRGVQRGHRAQCGFSLEVDYGSSVADSLRFLPQPEHSGPAGSWGCCVLLFQG